MSILFNILKSLRQSRPRNNQQSTTNTQDQLSFSEQYEQQLPIMTTSYEGTDLIFAAPNKAAAWRVSTLFSKEPDTIEWIKAMSENDIFVDIGANVGMYTILAAKLKKVQVFSFEPESQNYALLNRNIFLNRLSDKVTAYCLAMSDEVAYSKLYLSSFFAASSCHSFGEEIDFKLEKLNSVYAQGCISTTLDQLVSSGTFPCPSHIKIDVDGLEHKVITGCMQTLQNTTLKSVLIEINGNLPQHREIICLMSDLGFSFEDEQVGIAARKTGAFTGVGNYVFRR